VTREAVAIIDAMFAVERRVVTAIRFNGSAASQPR